MEQRETWVIKLQLRDTNAKVPVVTLKDDSENSKLNNGNNDIVVNGEVTDADAGSNLVEWTTESKDVYVFVKPKLKVITSRLNMLILRVMP